MRFMLGSNAVLMGAFEVWVGGSHDAFALAILLG